MKRTLKESTIIIRALKKVKTEAEVNHSRITSEILDLEKMQENNENIDASTEILMKKIEREMDKVKTALLEAKSKILVQDYAKNIGLFETIKSFNTDYEKKLDWIAHL